MKRAVGGPAGAAGGPAAPGAKKMRMENPATAAASTAVVAPKVGAVVPSRMAASSSENAVSLLNQYRHGLSYQVVSQVGPAHAPVFTVQLEVDGQVFTGAGVNKAAARYSAAQNAVQALRPVIEAELKQRALNRQEKAEQKAKAEAEGEAAGENGTKKEEEDESKEAKKEDFASDELGTSVNSFENKEQTKEENKEGNIEEENKEDQVRKPKGKNSLKVLREIRPGVVVAQKIVHGVSPGTYVAYTVVDGKEFEGRGASLSLAKALAAEVAVTTLFSIKFEHSAGGFPIFVGDSSEYIRFRLENAIAVWDDDKNPVMQLNELYYESAIYSFTDDGYELPDGTVVCDYGEMRHGASVTVDGIVAYGRGLTKKDAKTAAAAEAVRQLKACGLFQKRLTEKEINKAQRSTAVSRGQGASDITPYRTMVTGSSLAMNNTLTALSSENALAKLNKLYPGSTYDLTNSDTADITNTSFTMTVTVNGQKFLGTGRSKKLARLDAAENALRTLGHWTEEDDKAKAKFRKVVIAAKQTNSQRKSQSGSSFASQRGRGHRGMMTTMSRGQRARGGGTQGFSTGRGRGLANMRGARAGGRGTMAGSMGMNSVARGRGSFGMRAAQASGRGMRGGLGRAGMVARMAPAADYLDYGDSSYTGFENLNSANTMMNSSVADMSSYAADVSGYSGLSQLKGARGGMNVRRTMAQSVAVRGRSGMMSQLQEQSYDDYTTDTQAYDEYASDTVGVYSTDDNYSAQTFGASDLQYTSFESDNVGSYGAYSSSSGYGASTIDQYAAGAGARGATGYGASTVDQYAVGGGVRGAATLGARGTTVGARSLTTGARGATSGVWGSATAARGTAATGRGRAGRGLAGPSTRGLGVSQQVGLAAYGSYAGRSYDNSEASYSSANAAYGTDWAFDYSDYQ